MRRGTYFATSALVALNSEAEAGGVVIVTPPAEPEAASEAAIEIARIEGETAVELAKIEAETSIEHHELAVAESAAFGEALAENINESLEAEKTEWQLRAETAEAELAELKAAQSTPAQSPSEPPPSLPSAGAGGHENTPPPPAEVHEPAAEAESPPEPRKRGKSHRWI